MSAYANDPRVNNFGGTGEVYEILPTADSPSGSVCRADNGGWRARLDGMAGSPQQAYPTADDAIRSVLGDPQAPPTPAEAGQWLEDLG